MLISPLQFLALMLSVTALAAAAQWVVRRRQMSRLRRLAARYQMHFSAADRFRLAPRIMTLLPVPGAAAVRVADLIYGVERETYRYVFSAEYTTGVLRSKTSVRRVAVFCEPRTPASGDGRADAGARGDAGAGAAGYADADGPGSKLVFAPESLSLLEQYEHLLKACPAGPANAG